MCASSKQIAAVVFLLLRDAAEVHEKERVIQHHDVRADEPLARILVKALRIRAAAFRGADVRLAAHHAPDVRVRLDRKIRERAVARRLRPFADALELGLLGRSEQLARVRDRALEPHRAEIIRAPFPEHRFELERQQLLHDRDVFENELLLEIDRVRGNDRLLFFLVRPEHRRHEIRQRFSHARARLDHEVPLLVQRARDRHRHLLLLGPVLEILRLRHDSLLAEHRADALGKGIFKRFGRRDHEPRIFRQRRTYLQSVSAGVRSTRNCRASETD